MLLGGGGRVASLVAPVVDTMSRSQFSRAVRTAVSICFWVKSHSVKPSEPTRTPFTSV